MGAPKGNKYAVGHDGSNAGRPSFYTEAARAKELIDAWFVEGVDAVKLREKVNRALTTKGEKLKFFDLYLAKAIKDNRLLDNMSNKLISNKLDHTSAGEKISFLSYLNHVNPDQSTNCGEHQTKGMEDEQSVHDQGQSFEVVNNEAEPHSDILPEK